MKQQNNQPRPDIFDLANQQCKDTMDKLAREISSDWDVVTELVHRDLDSEVNELLNRIINATEDDVNYAEITETILTKLMQYTIEILQSQLPNAIPLVLQGYIEDKTEFLEGLASKLANKLIKIAEGYNN